MDPATHTLIGAALGQGFFKRRVGPEAVPLLMLASNLPDVDALILLTGSPAAITLRRTFGHSLLTLPFLALILALFFKRKYPALRLETLFGLSLLGAAVHLFFDLVNSFGVLLLWPLSLWRPELSIIFILDLILTAILAAPFLYCLPRWEGLPRACRRGLALAAAYVLFCLAGHELAKFRLSRQAQALQSDFSYVFPEPFGPHRWRGVLRRGRTYRVYLIDNLFWKVELKKEIETALDDPRVVLARETPDARNLENFMKAPVWLAQDAQAGHGPQARVYDLRFRPLVTDLGIRMEWVFPIRPDGRVERIGWEGRDKI